MNRKLLLPLTMLMMIPSVSGCDLLDLDSILIKLGIKEEQSQSSKIDSVEILGQNKVNVGSVITLNVNVRGNENANKAVTWSSENTSVAKVDNEGNVTGIASGTTKIIATSVANPSVKDEFSITVTQIVTKELLIEGGLTKKTYNFDDPSFDLSGLSVSVVGSDGSKRTLLSNEYTLSTMPKTPKGYAGTLTVVAKAKGYSQVTMAFNDINVGVEQYDEQKEKSEYYADLGASITLSSLQNHSFKKQIVYVKYGSIMGYYRSDDDHRSIEEIPGTTYLTNKYEAFYTGAEYTDSQISLKRNEINKEHVWACADSNDMWSHDSRSSNYIDNDYQGGGADLYHLRMCNSAVNEARGDAFFTKITGNCTSYTEPSSEYSSGGKYSIKLQGGNSTSNPPKYAQKVEPADEFKGDYARIIAYVYMHYGNHGYTGANSNYCGDLRLSDIIETNSQYSSIKDLLVSWNNIDPVSETEKYRNHTVEKIQGNRNPFVDHPEWISQVL